MFFFPTTNGQGSPQKKIWIDMDNSPHVPFFKPIVEELEGRSYSLMLTARDCFQVCGLADLLDLRYKPVGRHYGKNKISKVIGLLIRAMQLTPAVLKEKPDLALSHGSRTQVLLSSTLRIPSTVIMDYEYVHGLLSMHPNCVIVPEVIPDKAIPFNKTRILRYPGIKEDVYVRAFTPGPGILERLGITHIPEQN